MLQIRPIVDTKVLLDEDLDVIPRERLLMKTKNALGHGVENDVFDLIYVKPESFTSSKNQQTVYEVEKLNKKLTEEGRGYVLIGPGRWGSSDPCLGIPVKWPQIASARLIVEADLSKYPIDPSQGTHFFQNLTSFGVNYYTVGKQTTDSWCDFEYLNAQPSLFENEFVRHIRFDKPIVIKTDGKLNKGVVLKPE
jgi:hypothetical protein